MGNIPEKLLAGSVSRSVYSLFHGLGRTLFASSGRAVMHRFRAHCRRWMAPLVGLGEQRTDFSDFYGAGKVSA